MRHGKVSIPGRLFFFQFMEVSQNTLHHNNVIHGYRNANPLRINFLGLLWHKLDIKNARLGFWVEPIFVSLSLLVVAGNPWYPCPSRFCPWRHKVFSICVCLHLGFPFLLGYQSSWITVHTNDLILLTSINFQIRSQSQVLSSSLDTWYFLEGWLSFLGEDCWAGGRQEGPSVVTEVESARDGTLLGPWSEWLHQQRMLKEHQGAMVTCHRTGGHCVGQRVSLWTPNTKYLAVFDIWNALQGVKVRFSFLFHLASMV